MPSFYGLLSGKMGVRYDELIIPMYQRDYAQGRQSSERVTRKFIKFIYSQLCSGGIVDLDLVYGSSNISSTHSQFRIVDGQQRLTLLFLLHYYLTERAGRRAFKRILSTNYKTSRFRYETRLSSTEFCDLLVLNATGIVRTGISHGKKVSEVIKDMPWFNMMWRYDATIKSMLAVLDLLHELCPQPGLGNCAVTYYKDLYKNLRNINFQILDLNSLSLSEEVYIKMNARGKQLSNFENTKSDYEDYLDGLLATGKILGVIRIKFINNVDVQWADFFWAAYIIHRSLHPDSCLSYDDIFLRFIKVALIIFCAENGAQDEFMKPLWAEISDPKVPLTVVDFTAVSSAGPLNFNTDFPNFLNTFFDSFNYASHIPHFSTGVTFSRATRNISFIAIFDKFVANNPALIDFLWFYGFIRVGHFTVNPNSINTFDRVLDNLLSPKKHLDLNNPHDMSNHLNGLLSLAKCHAHGYSDVIDFLSSQTAAFQLDGFSHGESYEQVLKAHLLKADFSSWNPLFLSAEAHGFFLGRIGFLLRFSGIENYFDTHGSVPPAGSSLMAAFLRDFYDYLTKAASLFSAILTDSDTINYAFERAALRFGDYTVPANVPNRVNLLSKRGFNNSERDYSWFRVLKIRQGPQWGTRLSIIKSVLDDPSYNSSSVQVGLENIVSAHIAGRVANDTFQECFMVYDYLFDYLNQGWIGLPNYAVTTVLTSNVVLLYTQSQRNHPHGEMLTKVLEYEINNAFGNFTVSEYLTASDSNEKPILRYIKGHDNHIGCYHGTLYERSLYCDIYNTQNAYNLELCIEVYEGVDNNGVITRYGISCQNCLAAFVRLGFVNNGNNGVSIIKNTRRDCKKVFDSVRNII